MENPLVSVIIPCYNHAPYMRERIDSVLAQDYHDFEIILLDDCSTDNTAEIILSYKDEKHVSHIIINEENTHNTFIQWERGINLAKGEYIWIAESDDVAKPSFLSSLVSKLLENRNAVLAFSHSTMIDHQSMPLGYSWDEPHRYKALGIYDGKAFCTNRMVCKNLLYNASMIVFKREAYYKVEETYKKFRHSGDWLFWFEVCMQGLVCEVPRELNAFRQHPNKVSNESRATGKDFEEMGEIQQIISKKLCLTDYQQRCLRGRQTKRLRKSTLSTKEQLSRTYPEIYDGSSLDILLYTIDKITNWSQLQK